MAVTTERAGRPAGLQASTVPEAFQATAKAHPDRCALRTKGDEFSITWREYAEKVRATAAGLAGLGLERGSTMALMLTNRPEFHWFDAAAVHLGATPFSLYNTYTAEQIQYQVDDAEARIVVTEKAFADRVRTLTGVEHVIVVDDEGAEPVEAHAPQGFDFEAAWRRRGARRPAHPDLHLRHHRPAEGRAADPRERSWPASAGSIRSSSSRTRAG